jgi:hypothetical protein
MDVWLAIILAVTAGGGHGSGGHAVAVMLVADMGSYRICFVFVTNTFLLPKQIRIVAFFIAYNAQ